MSKFIPYCFGIASGLAISQNFNHKVIWGNKEKNIFTVSRPVSVKEESEISEMIDNIEKTD